MYATLRRSLLALIHKSLDDRLPYYTSWPAKVVTQNADGTIDCFAEDKAIRGSGIGNVSIRYGAPGWKANVAPGMRCLVSFEAGDPKRPYISMWDAESQALCVTHNNGAQNVSRVGDTVDAGTLYITSAGPPPVVSSILWSPPNGPVLPGVPVPLLGLITSGSPTLKA